MHPSPVAEPRGAQRLYAARAIVSATGRNRRGERRLL